MSQVGPLLFGLVLVLAIATSARTQGFTRVVFAVVSVLACILMIFSVIAVLPHE